MSFPDKAGEVNLPSDKMLAAVSAEDFVLACRAQTPGGVVTALIKTTQDSCAAGAPFRDFPIPGNVRTPLQRMLSDLQAWKSGQLAWEDVSRGFLISGPPGSGKTEIARALARDAGVNVVVGSIARWQASSDRSGAFMQNMQKFFTTAAAKAPCIAFIDELDAVGDRMRAPDHNSAYTDMVVTGLLECLDGFEQHEGVVFLGATNHLDKIDAAIRRPGRFDKILELGYPAPDLMPDVIRFHLKDLLPDAGLAPLAARAAGLSGAAVAALVRDAKGQARAQRRNLTFEDLEVALSRIRPQLPAELVRRIAVHEAAHAVVASALRTGRVTMVQLLETGGQMTQEAIPKAGTRAEIEALICVDLAGRAAEREILNTISGGAGGDANSDLAKATRRALSIERTSGLGDAGEFWHEDLEQTQFTLSRDRDLQHRVQQHLTVADVRAAGIVQANRDVLEQLAARLEKQTILTGEELSGLLSGVVVYSSGQSGLEGTLHDNVLPEEENSPRGDAD